MYLQTTSPIELIFVQPSLCLAAAHGDGGFRSDLALWGLIAFIGFVLVIRKLGWQSFVDGMSERERTENEAIAQAEQKNRQAQETLTVHRGRMEAISEEVDERLAEARRDAGHTRSDITALANREAETLRKRATGEMNRATRQALNDLFSTMATRVVVQTESRIKDRLNEAEHNRLIDEALGHFTKS